MTPCCYRGTTTSSTDSQVLNHKKLGRLLIDNFQSFMTINNIQANTDTFSALPHEAHLIPIFPHGPHLELTWSPSNTHVNPGRECFGLGRSLNSAIKRLTTSTILRASEHDRLLLWTRSQEGKELQVSTGNHSLTCNSLYPNEKRFNPSRSGGGRGGWWMGGSYSSGYCHLTS